MADRHDLFELSHKPLRLMWMELLATVGTARGDDAAGLAALEAGIAVAVELHGEHNRDESDWYGPRLAALDPELAARWLADHDDHLRVMRKLLGRVRALRAEPDAAHCAEQLGDLYRFLCAFVADDLAHMSLEQGEILFRFQAAYDDEQLREIEAAFLAERPTAAELERQLPFYLRACNTMERAQVLALVRQRTTAAAFTRLWREVVAPAVSTAELVELGSRLGVEAAA